MTEPPRLRDALAPLLPAADAPASAYGAAFRRVAELLLGRATWRIAGVAHRFTELEFYWDGRAHGDPFAHGDPMQRTLARWYHHRAGGSYRGGTFKGLDLTLGAPDVAAGILVRGVERLDGGRRLVDGPCLCVEHLLALTGSADVASLEASFDGSAEARPSRASPSYVSLDAEPSEPVVVYAGPRVGLTLKRGATPARVRYLAAPYRFLTEPARIRKGRAQLVVGMHREGRAAADIAALTGAPVARVARWVARYEAGRGRDPARVSGDDAGAVCELLGACARFAHVDAEPLSPR